MRGEEQMHEEGEGESAGGMTRKENRWRSVIGCADVTTAERVDTA